MLVNLLSTVTGLDLINLLSSSAFDTIDALKEEPIADWLVFMVTGASVTAGIVPVTSPRSFHEICREIYRFDPNKHPRGVV